MATSTEKQKLWKAFAEWIKLRDSEGGYAECISCHKSVKYPNSDGMLHAGHLFPRSVVYNALYFHPMNVHGQCHFCNTHLEGNTMEFRKGIVRRYGEDALEDLDIARATSGASKLYDHDYKEMAADYRKKSRAIKKERGIS